MQEYQTNEGIGKTKMELYYVYQMLFDFQFYFILENNKVMFISLKILYNHNMLLRGLGRKDVGF